MIGIYRPLRSDLSREALDFVNAIHCTGCIAGKNYRGRLSTLFYPYETDLLLLLAYGLKKSKNAIANHSFGRAGCTMFPPLRRNLVQDQFNMNKVAAAFSTVMMFAVLDDKIRDENKNYLKHFRAKYLEALPESLDILGIKVDTPPDPRLLKHLNEKDASTFPDYLELFEPFVAGLWIAALNRLNTGMSQEFIARLARNLSDIMLLVDMINDFESDRLNGQFNPLRDQNNLMEAEDQLNSTVSATSMMIRGVAEPYKEILINILTKGIYSILHKRRKKYDA